MSYEDMANWHAGYPAKEEQLALFDASDLGKVALSNQFLFDIAD